MREPSLSEATQGVDECYSWGWLEFRREHIHNADLPWGPAEEQQFLSPQGGFCLGIPCERKQQKFDVQELSHLRVFIMLWNTLKIEVINN